MPVSARAEKPEARLEQASTLLRRGQRQQAIAILDALRADPALLPIARFQLGWLYGQARRYETALAIFEGLSENVPDPVKHYYAIALCHFNLRQYERATHVLEEAKKRGFADAESANLLGVAYAKLGEAQKAYEALREGITKGAADVNGYLNLVTLCVDFGNNALAEKIATRAIEAFPSDSHLYLARGALKLAAGEMERARGDVQRAMALAPRDPDSVFFAAVLEYESGQYGAGMRILRKCIEAGFADAEIHYLLAESLLRSGSDRRTEALAEVDTALRMDNTLVPALLLRAKLRLGDGNTGAAVGDLEQARMADPENRSVLYLLGRAYQKAGREADSRALFERVQQDTGNVLSGITQKKMRKILVERAE